MTFLAPWWLVAAGAMAAAVLVLHLLARHRPKLFPFPTARFLPDRPATAAAIARRPSDLLLLLLRILVVALLGAAFAQPVIAPPRRTTRVVLLDRSRLAPPMDSAGASALRSADLVIAFDSAARVGEREAALHSPPSNVPGSLSAALVAALRHSRRMAGKGDSLALTIVSPLAEEEFDQATLPIRQLWKGRITLIQVQPLQPAEVQAGITLSPDDPLASTISLLSGDSLPVRLIRRPADPLDSAWVRSGGSLVVWPRVLANAGWPRGPGDSIGGVSAGNTAVVAGFFRGHVPPDGQPIAVWVDGKVAATETALGAGCLRSVAIEVPEAGDLVLRESFQRLSQVLISPCNGRSLPAVVSLSRLDSLRGGSDLPASVAARAPIGGKTPANVWLLLVAALIFIAEPLVRRRTAVT